MSGAQLRFKNWGSIYHPFLSQPSSSSSIPVYLLVSSFSPQRFLFNTAFITAVSAHKPIFHLRIHRNYWRQGFAHCPEPLERERGNKEVDRDGGGWTPNFLKVAAPLTCRGKQW